MVKHVHFSTNEQYYFIKTTGRADLAKLFVKEKKPRKVVYRIVKYVGTNDRGEESSESNETQIEDVLTECSKSIATKTVDVVAENRLVKFSSYNLFLVSKQKQVGYIKGHSTPMKSMNVFSFDSFPVSLADDQCLFKVEVS